jgi:hypothetical protein
MAHLYVQALMRKHSVASLEVIPMLRLNNIGKLAFLAGLSFSLGLANRGYCDYAPATQPNASSQSNPAPVITGGSSYGNQYSTYDLSSALSRDAAAKSSMTNANAAYGQALAQARKDFRISTDYRNAAKEVADARDAYSAAAQPVLNKLTDNADYHALVEGRTQLSIALANSNLTPQVRMELANKKLTIGNKISRMESATIAADSSVLQAKSRLTSAERALAELTSNFEASINTVPAVAAAKQALDSSKTEYAAAEGNLSGANLARNDLINSDQRNSGSYSSPYNNYLYSPYNYGYGYGYGGYPFIYPFVGGTVSVTPGAGNIVNLMQQQTGKFFPGT